jgi:hypothetical protein
MIQPENYLNNVFINCPFDKGYQPLFDAMVFAIHDCGFIARCAREEDDSGNVRIIKIIKIIDECRYGIHDISKADLDVNTQLARFNMPLELGLFMGAHRFAPKNHYNKEKRTLIMDTEQYRYQQFISDLAGQDIISHQNSAPALIDKVRNFLFNNSRRKSIASGAYIAERFDQFKADLPAICAPLHWDADNLSFVAHTICVTEWLKANPE